MPTRIMSVKLSERLDAVLEELARQRKTTRSALVREALEAYAVGRGGSVTARVDAAVSPIDGPADLSTNPKHLVDYGR